jgi:hypothetical protein
MSISKNYWQDNDWAYNHYSELQKRYLEKWVAIVNKKVVSSGLSPKKVIADAKRKTKVNRFPVIYVESGANFY